MRLKSAAAALSVAALSVGAVVAGGAVANAAPTLTTASVMAPQSSYDCIQWVEAFGWLYSDDRQRSCDLGERGQTGACRWGLQLSGLSAFEAYVSCNAADD